MAKPRGGNSEPEESGMGFKDKQKALDTLKLLDGRDVSYQYHVITSFVSRAKRTIQITKDEEKLGNLKEAQEIFENWLNDYKENHRSKENYGYIPIETVKGFRNLAKKYGVLDDDFCRAYEKEKGDYKALRGRKTSSGETTWDIERNKRLKEIVFKIKDEQIEWFETDADEFRGLPTKEHTRCILLGYSPEPAKIKKLIPQVAEKFDEVNDEDEDEEMEVTAVDGIKEGGGGGEIRKGTKRSHDDSSEGDELDDKEEKDEKKNNSDEPKKKTLKKEEEEEVEEGKKTEKEDKEESGLSFKDKDRANASLKSLEGRDVIYQYHAITGLIKRAERVIGCTKNEEKIKNMREAIEVYENWITDYNVTGRSRENFGYLPLDLVEAYKPLAVKYGIEDRGFLEAYEREEGDYKRLRGIKVPNDKITWDIERNNNLRVIVDNIKKKHIQWFETDLELRGLPTKEHTQCIMWAFSHDTAKLKKLLPTLKEKLKQSE